MYITNSPFADFMIVVAVTNPELGLKGISIFIVDADTPGLTVNAPLKKLGMGASEMAEIVFEDCRIPVENRLGPEEAGLIRALKVLTLGRIASAAFGVGLGRAAMQESRSYCSQRVQFGGPLTANQFVRFTIADMATRLEASWQLCASIVRDWQMLVSHTTVKHLWPSYLPPRPAPGYVSGRFILVGHRLI